MKIIKVMVHSALISGLLMSAVCAAESSNAQFVKKCEFGCMGSWFEEWEHFFNRQYSQIAQVYTSSMKEISEAYLITIDLPGIDKKNISMEVVNNRLIIAGEQKEETEKKEKDNYQSKRSLSSFRQSFFLPDDANLNAIQATSKDGVLKITVPKVAGKKVSKKIEIK